MTAVTFTIDQDELLGLRALAALDQGGTSGGDRETAADADAGEVLAARSLLDAALAGRLAEAGLPWAPAAGTAGQRAATSNTSTGHRLRRGAAYVAAAALLVVLWGGYARGWKWTGFQTNGELWDWLQLLLLPTAIAVIPVWLQYRKYINRDLRAVYGVLVVAWAGFVVAGYLVPLRWTGFRNQTVWSWTDLLFGPAVVAVAMGLAAMHVTPARLLRSLRPYQRTALAAAAAGWAVTVAGGYALHWRWTGFPGNTLWDWLQMVLVPLAFANFLQPAVVGWITGNAARRAARSATPQAQVPPRARPQGQASAASGQKAAVGAGG